MEMHKIKLTEKKFNGITHANGTFHFNGIRMPDINLYLIDGLLIDAGPIIIKEEFNNFFIKSRIHQVALTHIHEDHTGMAAWLQNNLGVPIYIHKDSLAEASNEAILSKYRTLIWGERSGFTALAIPEKIDTPDYSFKVIDTPGHHPQHLSLLEENMGWLFSGDLYINNKQDVAFESENITHTIRTIETILNLNFDTFFCFHAGIVEHGKKMFQQKLDFFLKLQESVIKLRKMGLNSKDIDDRLFPRKHVITSVSKGEWSSINMVKTL